MPSLAAKALAKALKDGSSSRKQDDGSPFRQAAQEAYDALKSDDFDAFADAFEAAVGIRLSTEDDD